MRRLAVAMAASLVALAGAVKAEDPAPPRPKIGLALGGGGARGGAHIGVLKVLESLHIPVDYVAGTSMGAVVGGLYAAGVPVDQIEAEMRSTDWSDLLADRPTYRDLVWRRKQDEGRYLLDLELGLRGGKILVPTGLRAGQKLGFKLQTLLLSANQVHDFSNLPVPFACVATDVETGDRVVLDHGDLADAILASMTIPGVFAPVEIDGKLLVDGGMADNLPVEVVRAMGADIVIAVSVGTPLATRTALGSFLGVTGQAFGFLTVRNAERSAQLADLVIRPDLTGIDSGNFSVIGEAIARGETAANASQEALARWSREGFPAARSAPAPPAFPLGALQVEGNERVDARVILARAGLREGETFQIPRARLALRRVFGMADFQWVRLGLRPGENAGDPTGIVFRVKEKPWGPTYLHFGLEFVDDLEGDADYALKANLTRANLNRRGGEWRNDFQLGSRPAVRTELFQPIDFHGRWFVAPWMSAGRSRQPIFENGQRIAYYAVDHAHAQLDGGAEYGRFGEVRLGVYRNHVSADVDTGAADLPPFDVDGGGIAFQASLDTLDRPAIPRHGTSAIVGGVFSRPSLGAASAYDRVTFGATHFRGRGRHTGFAVADLGTNLGSDLPPYDEFAIGGLFSLGGYSDGELRGQAEAGVTAGYHFRLSALPSGLGEGVYVGALVDARNVWPSSGDISIRDLRYGITLLLGADTLVGPIFLGYGMGEGGRERLYFTVGRSF